MKKTTTKTYDLDGNELEEDPDIEVSPELLKKIRGLIEGNPAVLFMKGSPSQPQCGFSANASAVLRTYGKPLAHFDVLSDPEVRQGIKAYSQWPTIPQVYVNGEFLGGSDILMQMHQAGELKEVIDEAYGDA